MTEDNDIKIFTPEKKEYQQDDFTFADEAKKQQINGNLPKAKQIGRAFANAFAVESAKDEIFGLARSLEIEMTDGLFRQLMILSVFTAEYCLKHFLTSDVLANAATSSMYSEMMRNSEDVYNDILRSNAFSFYYMTVGGKSGEPEEIGKTFAMLCGDKNSDKLIALGSRFHELSTEAYRTSVANTDFAK